MKILVLANRDIASCSALNRLLPELHRKQYQTRCYLSAKVGSGGEKSSALGKLKYSEQDLFVNDVFPKIDQAQKATNWLSFNQLAERYCDQTIQIENNINSADGIEKVSSYDPDLIISIRHGVILKEQVIKIPEHGVINLHSGKLPEYRGVMATFWAMLNKESSISSTLHWIDTAEIDNGGIIASSKIKLDSARSYLENVLALYPDGVALILNTVERISNSEKIKIEKTIGQDHYYSFPNAEDLDKFADLGYQLVNDSHIQQLIREKFTPGDSKK